VGRPGLDVPAPETTRRQPIDTIGSKKWFLDSRFREQEPTPQKSTSKGVKRMDDDIKAYFDQRFSQVDQRLVDLEIKLTNRMNDFA